MNNWTRVTSRRVPSRGKYDWAKYVCLTDLHKRVGQKPRETDATKHRLCTLYSQCK